MLYFAFEDCFDECVYTEYITDISSTQLSEEFVSQLSRDGEQPNDEKFIRFSVYYKTYESSRIAYHGKVRAQFRS